MSIKASNESVKIGIIGLGYVGLPLAVEFGKKYTTVGYDIDKARVSQLGNKIDRTNECTLEELQGSLYLKFSDQLEDVAECNVYIVTVPTPIDLHKAPDLSYLVNSSAAIGRVLSSGDIVVFESTVYPGATEEVCIPVLEEYSNLKFNEDFFVGYSPERINPGDKINRLVNIKKITLIKEYLEEGFTLQASVKKADEKLVSTVEVFEKLQMENV